MTTEERRQAIIKLLASEQNAVSGSMLAARFGVSRQIIVQDISILKALGHEILATHQGYMVQHPVQHVERILKVCHTSDQTEDELTCIVDLGGTVVDVFVWHKAFGRIDAKLSISSRRQVKQFVKSVRSGKSTELMHITGGYHYHTIRAESEEVLDQIEQALEARNYIVPEI